MKFVEKDGELQLLVGYHEWAGSARTTGMPVWALWADGHAQEIGRTGKYPASYAIPTGAVAVVRRYQSNSGLLTYHIYAVPSGTEYYVEEQFNFSIAELPQQLQKPVREFLEKTERIPVIF